MIGHETCQGPIVTITQDSEGEIKEVSPYPDPRLMQNFPEYLSLTTISTYKAVMNRSTKITQVSSQTSFCTSKCFMIFKIYQYVNWLLTLSSGFRVAWDVELKRTIARDLFSHLNRQSKCLVEEDYTWVIRSWEMALDFASTVNFHRWLDDRLVKPYLNFYEQHTWGLRAEKEGRKGS